MSRRHRLLTLMTLSGVLLGVPTYTPAQAATSTATASEAMELDEAQYALAPGLSLETRRYLLYLYARVNKPKIAEELARRILAESPGDKQTLLVLASMYIERNQPEKALIIGRELEKYYPGDDQALYFLGAGYYQAGQYQKANEVLRDLKIEQFKGKLYPYQTDLASAALQAGDWHRAALAYQELLRHHNLSDELRLKAREVLEGIYYKHLPQIELEGTQVFLDAGRIYRLNLEYSQALTDSHRLTVRWHRDDLYFKTSDVTPGFLSQWANRMDGELRLDTDFSRKWHTAVWLGGSDSGVLGGGSVTRTLGEQRDVTLLAYAQERSTDGLFAEMLDTRQNRLSLLGTWLMQRDWLAYWQIDGRELTIDHESLGTGYGVNFNLEKILFHGRPEFRVGYRAQYMEFFAEDNLDASMAEGIRTVPGFTDAERLDLLNGLVREESHRHGAYWLWRDQLSGVFFYEFGSGVDYAVDLSSWEYNAHARASYYPRKSIELRTGVEYSSSADTADQGSDEWRIIAALKYYF